MASYVTLTNTAPDYLSCPYDAARDVVDDFELRLHLRLPSWTPPGRHYLASDRSSTAGWGLNLETDGDPRLAAYIGSTTVFATATASLMTVATAGEWLWLKATRVGTVLRYYTSLNGTTWTQLGSDLTLSGSITPETDYGLAINAYASNGSLASGGGQSADYSRVQLWTGGIEGVGTLVNDFDASLATAGQPASVTASTGEVWTFNGTGYEVFHAGTAVTLSPDGFVSASGIEDQAAGTTDLHLAIDDSPDDSDADTTYLVNSGSATGTAWVTLSNTPVDFGEMLTLSVRVRARKEG